MVGGSRPRPGGGGRGGGAPGGRGRSPPARLRARRPEDSPRSLRRAGAPRRAVGAGAAPARRSGQARPRRSPFRPRSVRAAPRSPAPHHEWSFSIVIWSVHLRTIAVKSTMNRDSFVTEAGVPRSSPAHAAEVRQRNLAGAHRAFRARGFRGTTIPAIAAEADVSVGLIYRYFPSKEELFLSVCQTRTDAHLDELAATLAAIADPRPRLRAAIERFVSSPS